MGMTKEAVLAKLRNSLRTEEFVVPELDDVVTIRELSGRERDHVDARRIMEKDKESLLGEACVYKLSVALLGKDGKPLFTLDELRQRYEANHDLFWHIANRIGDLSELSPFNAKEAEKN